MLIREHYETREEWLKNRKVIGGSEAAAAVGKSPFMTNIQLWEYKTGRATPPDLSDNEAVQYGIQIEPALRTLYAAEYPEMEVAYFPYDILHQDLFPCLACTLDGELTEKATGRRGVLEIKTVQATSRNVWLKWQDMVPEYYFIQCMAQLMATGWEFVDLYAQLKKLNGDSEIRRYHFEREDHLDDIRWLKPRLENFWFGNVVADERPAMILPGL